MRFLTLFPEAENVHLIKDVGMIPYMLQKEYGHECTLACYENGSYPYLLSEAKGLNLVFIRKVFRNRLLDGLWFIWRNRKKYDVLQTYHYRFSSLLWLFVFKLVSGKDITYLKLDTREQLLDHNFNGIPAKVNKMLMQSVPIISVETKSMQHRLSLKWKRPIALIPNGCFPAVPKVSYHEKKQVILSVGRIGAPEKNHELLLEAFADFSDSYPSWTLQLTGPVEHSFHHYLDAYYNRYPHLKQRISVTGTIEDRALLSRQYRQAKIFCLSSRFEGFSLALAEAAGAGCYLVCSAFPAAIDITGNERYGTIFPMQDKEKLCRILRKLASDESIIDRNVAAIQEFAEQHFSWRRITGSLITHLKESPISYPT